MILYLEFEKMKKEDYLFEFIDFKDDLKSFVFRLVTNLQDAEDIIQDTFIKVEKSIDTFKGNSSFKTWVYAIAVNTAKNYLKKRNRWAENAQDYGASLHVQSPEHWDKFHQVFNATPDKTYEVKEHINYCFNCINKTLETTQQICLLLKEVYGFKVSEIMKITKLSEGKVKHALADARKNMVRIFDNRCSFVNKKGVCHQCSELTGALNQKHKNHIELTKIKLVNQGQSSDKGHLLDLRLEIVKNIDPLNTPNSIVNIYMLESCEQWVEEGKEKKVLPIPSET